VGSVTYPIAATTGRSGLWDTEESRCPASEDDMLGVIDLRAFRLRDEITYY